MKKLLMALVLWLGVIQPGFSQTAGWEFPTASSVTVSSADNGKILASDNVPGTFVTVNLANPSALPTGWEMGFSNGGGHGIVVNPPNGVYVYAGQKQLTSFSSPSNTNYEYFSIQSDGTNYRLLSATATTVLYNGLIGAPGGKQWNYLFSSGYSATATDNGTTITSALTGAPTTITLPSTGLIPNGWTISLYADGGHAIVVQPNNVSGGTLYSPQGVAVTSYTIQAPPSAFTVVSFDGASFRVLFSTPIGTVNVLNYGACQEGAGPQGGYNEPSADPAGTCDSTAAFNAALATGFNLYVPPGWYHVTNMVTCSGYGQVIRGAGRTQSVIDVGSDFNMSAAAVLALAPPTGTNPNFQTGCEVHDLGLRFYQNPLTTTRAGLIHYPWAISGVNAAATILDNVRLVRCWDGVNLTGNDGLFDFQGHEEFSCIDNNILADGELGYSHIASVVVSPNYGWNVAGTNWISIWEDCNTQAAIFGRIDGLDVSNFSSFEGKITVNANNNYVTGLTFANLDLNADGATVTVQGGSVSIGNFTSSQGTGACGAQLSENGTLSSTYVDIGNVRFAGSGTGTVPFQLISGHLVINGGSMIDSNNATLLEVTGSTGILSASNIAVSLNAGFNIASPIVAQTAGTIILNNISYSASGSHTGALLSIAVDNPQNDVDDISNISAWGTSAVSLGFTTSSGYYNLGNFAFPVTSTPSFQSEGDFVPSGNTVTGNYYRLGNTVQFDLNDTWSNNAYTTPSGAFFLATNLPPASALGGAGATLNMTQLSNFTLPASPSYVCAFTLNGASQIAPSICNSGASPSNFVTTNLPASTANLKIITSGVYRVR